MLTYNQELLLSFLSNEVWEKHKEHRFQWGLCPWRQEDVKEALDTGQEGNRVISVTLLFKIKLSHLRVPVVVQWIGIQLGIMRLWVWSLASLSGLRI